MIPMTIEELDAALEAACQHAEAAGKVITTDDTVLGDERECCPLGTLTGYRYPSSCLVAARMPALTLDIAEDFMTGFGGDYGDHADGRDLRPAVLLGIKYRQRYNRKSS